MYKKTTQILVHLNKIVWRFPKQIFSSIINTYMRPIIEYAVHTWSPWIEKRIYHTAIKLVIGLWCKPYEDWIVGLNLFDFRQRRNGIDLILMNNILNTTNHPLKAIWKPRPSRATRQHLFTFVVSYNPPELPALLLPCACNLLVKYSPWFTCQLQYSLIV